MFLIDNTESIMSYLERIKKLSTYSHLPNFAILSKNKLYLPNSNNKYIVLGKWSLDWIHSNKCAIGTVEQDTFNNILFQITSCYECTDNETPFQLVSKNIFTEFWNRVYHQDPLLSYIHINISEFYQSSPIVSVDSNRDLALKSQPMADLPLRSQPMADLPKLPKSPKPNIVYVKEVDTPVKGLIETTGGSRINARTVFESAKHQPQPKEKIIDTVKQPVKEETLDKFQVCKTDKPDVYHVYQNNKYVSTCLISNMKTSLHMQNVFEHKQIGEMVTMNMKLHVNTNKYYPII